ncbi:MAG: hypothetical protein ACFNYI_01935 [Eubacterium sp.]
MNNVVIAMGILLYMSSSLHLQMQCEQAFFEKKALRADADEAAVSAALTGRCRTEKIKGKKKKKIMVLEQGKAYAAVKEALLLNEKKEKRAQIVSVTCSGRDSPLVYVKLERDGIRAESCYQWTKRTGGDKNGNAQYVLHKVRV